MTATDAAASGCQPWFWTRVAISTVVKATTAPTDRSMPPVRNEGHADRDHEQEGIVDQQIEEHLRRQKAVVGEPSAMDSATNSETVTVSDSVPAEQA